MVVVWGKFAQTQQTFQVPKIPIINGLVYNLYPTPEANVIKLFTSVIYRFCK
jgi:hypothetical protein